MSVQMRVMVATLAILALASAAAAQSGTDKSNDLCVGGEASAPIRIEVFSDYQCPACRAFYLETIRQVLTEYSAENRVCVIYHDFPLNMHSHAREATRYALAARRLGREQWLRVSEALYTQQGQWAEDGKIEAAVAPALSPEDLLKVKKIMQEPSIEQTIQKEIALATARQVLSTPTFFISANGREQKVSGGIPYPILKDYLDRLLR